MRNSVFEGNSAKQGGAIAGETMQLWNATLKSNSAMLTGGGIYVKYVLSTLMSYI